VLIWAIPELFHGPSIFLDRSYWNTTLNHTSPLLTIPFPDDIEDRLVGWKTLCPWYFGSSIPFYFDMLCGDGKCLRFEIALKPDLSSASLHFVKTFKVIHDDFIQGMADGYKFCDDQLSFCQFLNTPFPEWPRYREAASPQIFSISHSGPTADVILPDLGSRNHLLSCPASGRFIVVSYNSDQKITLVELDLCYS
jgi:hypothetical protein